MKHRADALEPAVETVLDAVDVLEPAPSPGRHARLDEGPSDLLAPHLVPARATWIARHRRRSLVALVAVLSFAGAGGAAWSGWRSAQPLALDVAAGLAGLGLLSGLALVTRRPRRTHLSGATLVVRSGRREERFDLDDLAQRVELAGTPGRADWRLALGRPRTSGEPDLVLGRRDVDSVALDPLVRHWRELAERRRAERWAMLGL